ncbi:DUF2788 domain-containing protein [Hydrocarboniclastica marina]|uniref:DUF2788 domain-containing protein n=1 Tax=Hydrocarboniclastica marina TaxID=2259620 RepID=A0A4P7XF12_9ALTE|nr:DUF2788 domain-containing protein [Hydrocarboniclastica marina]MAL97131.1 hypothetical protein [Alteromonadaceae bacterium]QCF25539.1 DUF2788 domain-containing protein [Hydrocarboniclastica marina]|tara:strand:- start:8249 stop:8455 length:207 start_codon:yes stop_codon:yes gene_type:complete
MNVETFEHISLIVLIGGLVAFMAFIVWDLAKKSGAGRFGTAMLFVTLGAGVFGFLIKTVVVEVVQAAG